jgi:hypothetical protein
MAPPAPSFRDPAQLFARAVFYVAMRALNACVHP